MSRRLREESARLLEEYLQHSLDAGGERRAEPSTPAGRTLRIIAGEMLDRNRTFYEQCCQQLSGRPADILRCVAAKVMEDGALNWGRVVSIITFTGTLAQWAKANGTGTPKELAEVLSHFLAEEHGDWMESNGGWNGFHEHFCNNKAAHPARENNAVSGALMAVAGVGLAGLAFLLAVR
uniref:Bcl-2 Bcl-2 homology region 1-3 domain-containing protein n=1 Tax=Leptobrachium leishanense TaxID=445787 RepID=A0A8C5N071_9ANUR